MAENGRNRTMSYLHLRIARPVSDLNKSCELYCQAIKLEKIAEFSQHDGFSGVMLGRADLPWHLEFTVCHTHPVSPGASAEDLLVLYLPDKDQWDAFSSRMDKAGFVRVDSFNPYWDVNGVTFKDHDGYRTVLQNKAWG